MIRSNIFGSAALIALTLSGCVDREAQKQAKATEKLVSDPTQMVTAVSPRVETLQQILDVTGEITTSQDSQVAPKSPGRIVAVYVHDGDQVSAGQLIAQQDPTQLLAQQQQAMAALAQARAQVLTARSAVSQAASNMVQGPAKSSAAVDAAVAALRAAESQLLKAKNGARPEERRQTLAQLASAKSNLATQKSELSRIKILVEQGALAGNRLEQQQTTYDAADAQYQLALENVRLQTLGTRSEDLQAAEDAVRQAKENVRTARANKQLDSLLKDQYESAKAQLQSATAQVQSAQAQLAIANQALSDAQIRAPFAGKVSGKPIQAGTVPGAGTTAARIIGNSDVYYEGQVAATDVAKVQVGRPVTMTIDAFAGKRFPGRVVAINPLGSTFGRQFSFRVNLAGDLSALKPGMFAHGLVVVGETPNAILIPQTSVVTKNGKPVVFLIEGGKAKQTSVTLGQVKDEWVQATGVSAEAKVIGAGATNIVDGTLVRVREQSTAENSVGSTVGG